MNKKITIAIAIISLSAALILPIYALIEESNQDFTDLIHRGPLLDETDLQSYLQSARSRQQTLLIIIGAAEVVLVLVFFVALWLSLKP
jgi:hypothetical protein